MHEVIELERQAWRALTAPEARAFFDRVLTEDATMVIPGGTVLDRPGVLQAWDQAEPWLEFRLDDERVTELSPDVALLVYHATARRASQRDPYRAVMTSVYVRRDGDWRMAFHQQTP